MNTPYYEIEERKLNADIAMLQQVLAEQWKRHICAFSVKTNSLPWLLVHFRDAGFYAELVSAEEYDLVRRLGFAPDRVIYNGPVKDQAVFARVLQDGGMVNLDSSQEPEWLAELAAQHPEKTFSVGLRVNVDFRKLVPEEVPADAEGSRFGYDPDNGELEQVICALRRIPQVRIAGLHLHSSTKSRSVRAYEALADLAVRTARQYDLSPDYVDMGGGYYGGVPGKPDFRDYVPAVAARLGSYFDQEKTALVMEPGVSLVSSSFTLVTAVRDVKRIGGQRYVVTDGSRLYLNPQVTRRWYPHHFVLQSGQPRVAVPTQMICGSTCMEYDRLFEAEGEPALAEGDLVVYDLAGGYTVCLVPLFIHYFPAVYVRREDGTVFTAREPWTNDEFLLKNHV